MLQKHWSPLELKIIDKDKNNLDNELLTNGDHCSPLELEIVDDGDDNLIKVLLTIRAYWSPLELEIEDEDDNNLTKELPLESIGVHLSPLEFIVVVDCI